MCETQQCNDNLTLMFDCFTLVLKRGSMIYSQAYQGSSFYNMLWITNLGIPSQFPLINCLYHVLSQLVDQLTCRKETMPLASCREIFLFFCQRTYLTETNLIFQLDVTHRARIHLIIQASLSLFIKNSSNWWVLLKRHFQWSTYRCWKSGNWSRVGYPLFRIRIVSRTPVYRSCRRTNSWSNWLCRLYEFGLIQRMNWASAERSFSIKLVSEFWKRKENIHNMLIVRITHKNIENNYS